MLLENIMFIFVRYSDKKIYKILLIISIIVLAIDIILFVVMLSSLDEIFKTIENNMANLII